MDFESSRSIQAAPDEVFAFVSDVENLPSFVPTARAAQAAGAGRAHVEGEALGRTYDSEGYFRADPARRRMDWGVDVHEGYSGWLEVAERDPGSQVTIHLSFPAASPDGAGLDETDSSRPAAVRDGLDASLASLDRLVSEVGGPAERSTAG